MVPWVQTIRLKGHCSRSAHLRLDDIFAQCCELYNACLESWKGTYQWWKEHHPDEPLPKDLNQSLYDRMRMFTDVRSDHPEWERLDTRVGRGVLCRFDRAVRSFYKRCKDPSRKAGFPRFKPCHRWKSVEIVDAHHSMLKVPGEGKNHSERWWRLTVKGVPQIRFEDKGGRLSAALESGSLVELRVVRTPLRVEVHAVVKHPDRPPATEPVSPVGLDKGLKSRLVTSDGEHLPPATVDIRQAVRAQRKLSRSVKGSRSRIKKRNHLAKQHRRLQEQASQADFRLADRLVRAYDGIAVEDLNIAGLLKSRWFSKQMSQQRWGAFDLMLEHKAVKAGVRYVKVNPRHTSTDCSQCGHRQKMPLSERTFRCEQCGLRLCRDINSAINIRARAYPWSRGRVGHDLVFPDAVRATNLCCKTPLGSGQAMRTDTAEQYHLDALST